MAINPICPCNTFAAPIHVFLHLGFPRTGSTALQIANGKNFDVYGKNSINELLGGEEELKLNGIVSLVNHLGPSNNFFYSNENWLDPLLAKSHEIENVLEHINHRVMIIVTTRPRMSWIKSYCLNNYPFKGIKTTFTFFKTLSSSHTRKIYFETFENVEYLEIDLFWRHTHVPEQYLFVKELVLNSRQFSKINETVSIFHKDIKSAIVILIARASTVISLLLLFVVSTFVDSIRKSRFFSFFRLNG